MMPGDRGACHIGLQRNLPMLAAPLGGVGGINRDHPQTLVGAHLGQPIPEPPGRDAGYGAPQPLAWSSSAEGLAALSSCVGELEVLDGDRPAAVRLGDRDELADRSPKPPIPGR
jgi:hypothetical protein